MPDENDFAMMYSEERKKRMRLEDRVHSMIADVQPFLIAATDLAYDILDGDMEQTAKRIQQIVAWGAEVNLNVAYNILFPVGELLPPVKGVDIRTLGNIGDLPEDRLKELVALMKAAAKRVEAEWVDDGICSRKEAARLAISQFEDKFREVKHVHDSSKKEGLRLVSKEAESTS